MIWLYIILALIVLVGLVLLLRLRIRVVLDGDERILFAGLGRSGPEIDFVRKVARLRIGGITFKRYSFEDLQDKVTGKGRHEDTPSKTKKKQPDRESRSLSSRLLAVGRQGVKDFWFLLRTVPRAAIGFAVGIVRDCKLEELQGRIEAGFDSPDATGQAYGYYCAVAGALPGTVGRFRFVPVWTGASFDGSIRLSVGLPLYRLLFRTVRLIWQLPIRKLWKIRKAQSEGGSDE